MLKFRVAGRTPDKYLKETNGQRTKDRQGKRAHTNTYTDKQADKQVEPEAHVSAGRAG
jgi:predicted transcriptional regulator